MLQLQQVDSRALLNSLTSTPVTAVRINPKKNIPAPSAEKTPWCSSGFYLNTRPSFTHDPLFHAGCYYVQEPSSMFLEQAFLQVTNRSEPLKVLDLCAAPGGKSTHLLSLLPEKSILVSNEVIRSRVSILSMNIQKWGYSNAIVTNSDPADFRKLKGYFDVILTDAPCSGEGLFRKDPEAIKEWSPEQVQICSARQNRILEDVWPALKTDGILIYSTCTFNEEENEKNLVKFLQSHKGVSVSIDIPKHSGITVTTNNQINGYRFYPHLLKGEGFFLSVIKKTAEEPSDSDRFSRRKDAAVKNPMISGLMNKQDEFVVKEKNGHLFAVPQIVNEAIEHLNGVVHITHAGVAIGEIKHDKLVPEHALALSIDLRRGHFPEAELSEDNALRFLRKEPFEIKGSGMTLFTYKGFGIGWGNILPSRINNLLPNSWRILK